MDPSDVEHGSSHGHLSKETRFVCCFIFITRGAPQPQTRVCLDCCLFCAHATSLSVESVISQLLCVSIADNTFRDLVSYLVFKPADVEILCKTLTIWIFPPSRILSRSSNLERRRTLLPSLDDLEGCARPFGFSKNLCCSPHLHLFPPTQSLPQLHDSDKQSLKSPRPCGEVTTSVS